MMEQCVHVQHRFIEKMAYRAPISLGDRRRCCCHRCRYCCCRCCRRCWLSQHKFHNLYFRRLCASVYDVRVLCTLCTCYIYFIIIIIIFSFVSLLSGEFKQIHVLHTEHVFRHLSFRLIDFWRSARSFTFALIKNYGMRWKRLGRHVLPYVLSLLFSAGRR